MAFWLIGEETFPTFDLPVAVEMKANEGEFVVGAPQILFKAPISSPYFPFGMDYDVSADGQRFLISASMEEAKPPISVILNWTQLIPAKR